MIVDRSNYRKMSVDLVLVYAVEIERSIRIAKEAVDIGPGCRHSERVGRAAAERSVLRSCVSVWLALMVGALLEKPGQQLAELQQTAF